jgi:TIR domain
MPQKIPSFYICYQTGDVTNAVEAIVELLTEHIGDRQKVFYDQRTIEAGEKWTDAIEARLRECSVFILVIGPNWGKTVSHQSSPAHSPDQVTPTEWVGKEMVLALKLKKTILPVLVDLGETKRPVLASNLSAVFDQQELKFTTEQLRLPYPVRKLHHTVDYYLERFRQKPVAFVSSTLTYIGDNNAIDGLDFFTNLLGLLVQTIHLNGQEVVLKVPSYSSDDVPTVVAGKQLALIRDVFEEHLRYQAVVIAPFSVTEELADILALARREHPYLPIALIDKGFCFDQPKALVNRIRPIISVENDALFNGWLAGLCVSEYLLQRDLKDANVIIINGLEGSAPRIGGFRSFFYPSKHAWHECWEKFVLDHGVFGDANGNSHNSNEPDAESVLIKQIQAVNVECRVTRQLPFTKDAGREAVNDFLRDKRITWHAIFACNDELALGADMALKESSLPNSYPNPIPVVGFDGIRDAVRQLKSRESYLLNTIDVDLGSQVTKLGKLLRVAAESGAKGIRLSNRMELVRGKRTFGHNEQKRRGDDLVRVFESHR